jgi:homoserine dehydrogenase
LFDQLPGHPLARISRHSEFHHQRDPQLKWKTASPSTNPFKKAQSLGIAETDASHDIDAWDAAVKTAALITVLMDVPIRLEEIDREGIRGLSAEAVQAAKKEAIAPTN